MHNDLMMKIGDVRHGVGDSEELQRTIEQMAQNATTGDLWIMQDIQSLQESGNPTLVALGNGLAGVVGRRSADDFDKASRIQEFARSYVSGLSQSAPSGAAVVVSASHAQALLDGVNGTDPTDSFDKLTTIAETLVANHPEEYIKEFDSERSRLREVLTGAGYTWDDAKDSQRAEMLKLMYATVAIGNVAVEL